MRVVKKMNNTYELSLFFSYKLGGTGQTNRQKAMCKAVSLRRTHRPTRLELDGLLQASKQALRRTHTKRRRLVIKVRLIH